ncbi:hypothetical protein BC938DRAFT_479431 [Jimgerdemannia flammicorona]|uniref:Uncharacterized protein n=1 Tax=Jimgerdemannia flammicorona TaxID=994334 RepID=A0A433QKU2_9FUNG|nr:hypothetical protein BC938DRAFT_479431 [Jimgerdemannia flammicorona]
MSTPNLCILATAIGIILSATTIPAFAVLPRHVVHERNFCHSFGNPFARQHQVYPETANPAAVKGQPKFVVNNITHIHYVSSFPPGITPITISPTETNPEQTMITESPSSQETQSQSVASADADTSSPKVNSAAFNNPEASDSITVEGDAAQAESSSTITNITQPVEKRSILLDVSPGCERLGAVPCEFRPAPEGVLATNPHEEYVVIPEKYRGRMLVNNGKGVPVWTSNKAPSQMADLAATPSGITEVYPQGSPTYPQTRVIPAEIRGLTPPFAILVSAVTNSYYMTPTAQLESQRTEYVTATVATLSSEDSTTISPSPLRTEYVTSTVTNESTIFNYVTPTTVNEVSSVTLVTSLTVVTPVTPSPPSSSSRSAPQGPYTSRQR